MSGGSLGCHEEGSWVLLASSGCRPEMMVNLLIMHGTAAHNPEFSSPLINSEKPRCSCTGTISISIQELKNSTAGCFFLPACKHRRRKRLSWFLSLANGSSVFVLSDRAALGHSALHVSPFPQAPGGLLPGAAWHRCREETREYRVGLGAVVLASLRGFSPSISRFFPSSVSRFACRPVPCIAIHVHDTGLIIAFFCA